jgi:tyrosyl-tRNA synthetase
VVAYDGFEPSGRMHIAQGVMKALNVNKLTKCGVTFKFWVADWFALMNNKMGGDLAKIQTVGRYMCEVWKAVGMDMSKVQFLSSSEEINGRAAEYWPLVLDIARQNSLQRIVRCSQIMGRGDTDELSGTYEQPRQPSLRRIITPCCNPFPLRLGQSRRYISISAWAAASSTLTWVGLAF